MKKGSRILGIDDGPRDIGKLIGVLYRGTEFIEQVEIIDQKADTGRGTESILELYNLFNQYIEAIILDGISFNGFNIVNIEEISRETETPVITVTTNKPNKNSMKKGLKSVGLDPDIIEGLPEVYTLQNGTYIQFSGCNRDKAIEIIQNSTLQGKVPEAVRAAHVIGTGLK